MAVQSGGNLYKGFRGHPKSGTDVNGQGTVQAGGHRYSPTPSCTEALIVQPKVAKQMVLVPDTLTKKEQGGQSPGAHVVQNTVEVFHSSQTAPLRKALK